MGQPKREVAGVLIGIADEITEGAEFLNRGKGIVADELLLEKVPCRIGPC